MRSQQLQRLEVIKMQIDFTSVIKLIKNSNQQNHYKTSFHLADRHNCQAANKSLQILWHNCNQGTFIVMLALQMFQETLAFYKEVLHELFALWVYIHTK